MKTQVKLYERVQPYERAGIPEEFYEMLLWDKRQLLELTEVAGETYPTDDELRASEEYLRRYHAWRKQANRQLGEDVTQ